MSFSDNAVVTVERNYYMIHFWGMNKSEVVNKMKRSHLIKKVDNVEKMGYYSDGK